MKKNPTIGPILEPRKKRERQLEIFRVFTKKFQKENGTPPQIARQAANFLEDLLDKNWVQEHILALREDLCVPANGFELCAKDIEKALDSPFFIPDLIRGKVPSIDKIVMSGLEPLVDKTLLRNFDALSTIFRLFLFFNAYDYRFAGHLLSAENYCKITNIDEEWLDYQPGKKKTNDSYFGHIANERKIYPVNIRISPHAGQNDVVDFVKKHWKKIKAEQSKFLSKETRLKNYQNERSLVRDRDRFIYENRHLTLKQIFALIPDSPDEGALGAIISKERKRRED